MSNAASAVWVRDAGLRGYVILLIDKKLPSHTGHRQHPFVVLILQAPYSEPSHISENLIDMLKSRY